MPGVMGSLGSIFGKIAPAVTGATAGAGLIGNIINSIQRSRQTSALQSAEKKYANLSPEQFSSLVTRAEQPLSQDLLQSVGNAVQADVASRGLAESPGIFAATETQTLAPYKLQEQQMAVQQVLKQLGLPIEYADAIINSIGPNVDVSKLLALLQGGGGPTGGVPQNVPNSNIGAVIMDILNSQGPPSGITIGGWTGDASTLADSGGQPA